MFRVIGLALVCAGMMFAQGRGVVFGNVVDSSGAAIASATVIVTNQVTGALALPAVGAFGTSGADVCQLTANYATRGQILFLRSQ